MSTTRILPLIGKVPEAFFPRGWLGVLTVAVVLPLANAGVLLAQGEEEVSLPSPVELEGNDLVTRDGVQLTATFYPGNRGQESVPVILLHMWKGDRKEYAGLAPYLQEQGCAVLVPDLRGHGASTVVFVGNTTRELDAAKMPPDQFTRMVTYDMETLRSFLKKKDQEGELNIEKLCLVGAEMGASVAVCWARNDWNWPPLLGQGKQGQYVKALVLISPKWTFPGLKLRDALAHPAVRSRLSVLIVVGGGSSREVADAKRVNAVLKPFHPDPPPEEATEKQDLFFGRLDTKLQGTKMLGVRALNLERSIARFIELRLTTKSFP